MHSLSTLNSIYFMILCFCSARSRCGAAMMMIMMLMLMTTTTTTIGRWEYEWGGQCYYITFIVCLLAGGKYMTKRQLTIHPSIHFHSSTSTSIHIHNSRWLSHSLALGFLVLWMNFWPLIINQHQHVCMRVSFLHWAIWWWWWWFRCRWYRCWLDDDDGARMPRYVDYDGSAMGCGDTQKW